MKKPLFILAAIAVVSLTACSNSAETAPESEAVVEETVKSEETVEVELEEALTDTTVEVAE